MSGFTDEDGLPPRRSDEEIAAAVAADPDEWPIRTAEEIAAARERAEALDVHGVMRLRRRLGIAQFIFANRYKIPLKSLDEWERGVSAPDRAMRVLLAAIAADPEGVARAAERADEPGFLLGGVVLAA